MQNKYLRSRLVALILGVVALALTGWAMADPPTRVARLGYISGEVSFSPAGENEWVHGAINRPLTAGDRLWVAPGARAELQIGVAAVRMSGSTSVTLLNLDDRVTQIELAQGELNIRVRRLGSNQAFEIDTPNLAFSLRRPGDYRIEVDPADDVTTVLVRDGQAEVYSEGAAYTIGSRQSYSYYGTGLRDYEYIDRPRVDEFDRWSIDRDRRAERSVSLRYVSPDVIGYEDLDANGTWRTVAGYGNVWVPSRVDAGWAPYRDGHWAWVEPWGWTWVDEAPWGFAVSHYGRWANMSGTWGWVPGPVRQQAVYAPALVAFVGGSNFRLSISSGNVLGVAWFPLAPRDVYRPSYAVSRDYFTRVNTSNTVINTTNITTVYNNNSTNITYINQQVPGAIVAVPTTAFVQSQPVSRAAVRLNAAQIVNAPVSSVAAIAPVQRSVIGPTAPMAKPAMNRVERPVVARTAPPPPPVAFAARESALAATPGKPLAPVEVQRLKPGPAAVPAPQVVVAAPVKPAVPMANAQPSKPAPGAGARGEGGPAGQRGRPDQTAPPSDTSPKPQSAPQPPVAAPVPDSRVPPGKRGRVESAPQPVAPTIKPQPASPSVSQPAPQLAAPAPVVAPPDSRVPPGQRGRVEPAPQPVAPTVKPQPAPTSMSQPAPQPAPPAPVVAPSDSRTPPGQRGRVEQPVKAPDATVKPQAAPQPPAAAPTDQRPAPGQRGRPEPQPQPAPQPPATQPTPKPQPVPQAIAQPPAATPAEQRLPPGQRLQEQPAPPMIKAQPVAPAPPSAGRPPEQRQAAKPPAQTQPSPNAPPAPNAEQRGPPPKAGAPKAEDKRSPEPAKQDEQQRQDDEKKGRKPN